MDAIRGSVIRTQIASIGSSLPLIAYVASSTTHQPLCHAAVGRLREARVGVVAAHVHQVQVGHHGVGVHVKRLVELRVRERGK